MCECIINGQTPLTRKFSLILPKFYVIKHKSIVISKKSSNFAPCFKITFWTQRIQKTHSQSRNPRGQRPALGNVTQTALEHLGDTLGWCKSIRSRIPFTCLLSLCCGRLSAMKVAFVVYMHTAVLPGSYWVQSRPQNSPNRQRVGKKGKTKTT